ncbi:MAG: hypothetical protein ACRDQW_05760, partial [Haloechinothrix sp.]
MFFTATGGSTEADLARFRQDAQESSLPSRDLLAAGRPADWGEALRLLAAALPDDAPSAVVIDELRCWVRSPFDLASMLSLDAADAFDAALITGGLPLTCTDWQPGQGMW